MFADKCKKETFSEIMTPLLAASLSAKVSRPKAEGNVARSVSIYTRFLLFRVNHLLAEDILFARRCLGNSRGEREKSNFGLGPVTSFIIACGRKGVRRCGRVLCLLMVIIAKEA